MLFSLGLAAPLVFTGCDAPAGTVEALEERLKDEASTERKTGVLQAIEILSSARTITERMAAPLEVRCQLQLPDDRAYTYEVSLDVQRRSPAGVEQRWTESRTLRRDDDGDLAATMDARFRTELGDHGRRAPQWRLIDRHSYVSADGRAFFRREAAATERARLIHSASGTLQSLLDAASTGWSLADEGDAGPTVFTLGGDRLVCGPVAASEAELSVDPGWLRRFETRATPLGGELTVPAAGSRKLELRWQLEDGSTLEARVEDRLVDGAERVDAPEASSVVDARRDRSLEGVEELIDEMNRLGLIEGAAIEESVAGEVNQDEANHDSE